MTPPFNDNHGMTLRLDTRVSSPEVVAGHLKLGGTDIQGNTLGVTSYYLERNGRPWFPVMGEFHYARFPRSFWDEALRKIKAGGVDIVATYIFWIYHEEEEGTFDWSGDRDLRAFVTLCARHGLQVLARIGPFAHGECRNGGLPDWLYGRPFAVRSTDERFLAYVRRLYAEIGTQLAGLLFKTGGPVVGVQLDNEYMHAGAPWDVTFRPGVEWVPAGDEGVAYMRALKDLALVAGLDVPLFTCTGWESPVLEDEMLPMQGGYAFWPWMPDPKYQQPPTREFLFRNRHREPRTDVQPTYDAQRYPYACCELGGGIQITYHHRPVVPAACVEAMAVVAVGSGANLLGYYMYHGGSHPIGRNSYLNEHTNPRISYDFQAPIREFGQIAPSYRALKLLHLFLHAYGDILAPLGVALPEDAGLIAPEDTSTLRWAARTTGDKGFLFFTNYQDHVEMHDLHDLRLRVELDNELLEIPRTGGLTLARDASAILPLNLQVSTVRLIYATAQPLTIISGPEEVSYIFFALSAISAEYAFDRTTYRDLTAPNAEISEEDDRVYVALKPGLHAWISLTTHEGHTVQVLTLTREQALRSWKYTLWGQERLVIADATVLQAEGKLLVSTLDQQTTNIAFYPPLPCELQTTVGQLTSSRQGAFSHCAIRVPRQQIPFAVTMLGQDRCMIHFSPGALEQVKDAFLRIDYVGDIGEAYLDGHLISDNFYNGTTWEIGLARFTQPRVALDLVVHITALGTDANAMRYVPTGMAVRLDMAGDRRGHIQAVAVVPAYELLLWAEA